MLTRRREGANDKCEWFPWRRCVFASQSLRTSQRRSPLDSSLVTGQRLPKRPVREEEPVLRRTQEFPLPPEFPPIILIGGPSIIVIALKGINLTGLPRCEENTS